MVAVCLFGQDELALAGGLEAVGIAVVFDDYRALSAHELMAQEAVVACRGSGHGRGLAAGV